MCCIGKRFPRSEISFQITCCSRNLANGVQDILIRNCDLNKVSIGIQRSSWSKKDSFRIYYHGAKQCKRIFDFIYRDGRPYLNRKKEKIDNFYV